MGEYGITWECQLRLLWTQNSGEWKAEKLSKTIPIRDGLQLFLNDHSEVIINALKYEYCLWWKHVSFFLWLVCVKAKCRSWESQLHVWCSVPQANSCKGFMYCLEITTNRPYRASHHNFWSEALRHGIEMHLYNRANPVGRSMDESTPKL